ncbi:MAG: T9SS type A sorting domain-containing protein, partial [Ignavibacteriaceae bacterium]|nr:T9SS type A sorting domain-containing protein [Ignavibacteriaceae bacterium]
EVEVGTPMTFALDQNYPNPFNPATTIAYRIPEASVVTLKVFDITGTEVATLVNTKQEAGSYTVNFDASKLSSGMYIFTIQAGEFSATKKMMLLK